MQERRLLEIAIHSAIRAGKVIREIYTTDFSVEQKEDLSPLTLADKKSHDIIESGLLDTGIPILSEEGKHMDYQLRSKWEKLWVVDPLDGTKEFVKRNGEFTVNIALIEGNEPVLGVVYVPVSGELYFASKKDGAYKVTRIFDFKSLDTLLCEKLPLNTYSERDVFVAVGSRSHVSPETQDYFNTLSDIHGRVQILSKGSSLKLCMVAEGAADVYPRFAPTMEWDTAAGHAICKFAGCEVLSHGNKIPLEYNKPNLINPWFLVERLRVR